ncbi:MAG: putative glycoside hydrolase, partial [Polyangiaceae bacterium]
CLSDCSSQRIAPPTAAVRPAEEIAPETAMAPEPPFVAWLRERLPPGSDVVRTHGGGIAVVHTVAAGDTADTIAEAHVELTEIYRARDLAAAINKETPVLTLGAKVEIPDILSAPPPSPEADRLRWPPDRALRGVFISGVYAGLFWPETIEKLAAHGLNAVVLDGKDYMGTVNYPTKVKLALETGAAKDPPIPDLSRAIRFAHSRGIHVIIRIPCFHDPWAAKHAPRLSLMTRSGRPFEMGWIDPANPENQDYIADLAKEVVALGADELQLDYVRFPVQAHGLGSAVMPAPDGHRSRTIKRFVARVHEATEADRVPLSLDTFGVTATGDPSDIEALGQNLGVIGSAAEVVSPMVYPSHYAPGWHGFDEPGDHPEIIGIGTRGAIDKLKAANVRSTIIRPWLQASSYKASNFGPEYIRDEIKSAEHGGGVGWLMWDPTNSYWAVWRALPVVRDKSAAEAHAQR